MTKKALLLIAVAVAAYLLFSDPGALGSTIGDLVAKVGDLIRGVFGQ